MEQALIIITIIFATITCYAQQYAVYRVKGEVCQVVKKKKVPMKKGMKLSAKDILNMSAKSEIKLFDEQAREMITLKNQCAGSISSLIASQKQSRQSMTAEYFAYISKNMKGLGQEESMMAGRTTAVFRNDRDSLLCKKDSAACGQTDSTAAKKKNCGK